jgi:hypothetical protein
VQAGRWYYENICRSSQNSDNKIKEFNMVRAIIAGILNLLIPGLGLAYLKKWKMAIAYFFVIPLYVVISFFTLSLLTGRIKSEGQNIQIIPNVISLLFYAIALGYIIWDVFITPFNIARGKEGKANPVIATILSVITPGLGFIYLKQWSLALGYLFWSPIVLGLGGSVLSFMVLAPITVLRGTTDLNYIFSILATIIVRLYVVWDSSHTTYKTAKKMIEVELKLVVP